jgi:hypothetical protein
MALGAILGAGSLLGGLFGGAAKGQAQERSTANQFNLGQDALRNQQYGTKQSALMQLLGLEESGRLNRAKIGLDAPGQRTRQAILGSLLQNLQPMQLTPPPGVRMGNIQGGMSPALLNQGARGAGAELQKQALLALLTKSDVPAMPDTSKSIIDAPQLSQYQKAGKGESLLSILGLIGGGMGAMQPFGQQGGQGAPQSGGRYPGMTPPFYPGGF